MRQITRYFILFYGLFETFVFTGNIFGWTALHYMLRKERIYENYCNTTVVNSSIYSEMLLAIANEVPIMDDTDSEKYRNTSVLEVQSWQYNGSDFGNIVHSCDAQDRMLNLAFTVGSFCIGSTAFVWGFLLDSWGLRYVRLFINGLITTGTVLLSLTERDTSYLIFPSLILMCLAGVPLRLANMQIADMFPKQRSTVITLYSGAFTASASVFVFIKYGFDAGLPWEWACFLLVVLSVVMLPVTLFVLPADRIREPTEQKTEALTSYVSSKTCDVSIVAPTVWGTYSIIQTDREIMEEKNESFTSYKTPKTLASPTFLGALSPVPSTPELTKQSLHGTPSEGNKNSTAASEKTNVEENKIASLSKSLCTVSFMFHQYWFCWLLLYTIIYVGTLHLWSERATDDPKQSSLLSEIYGLLQITGLVFAPLGGLFMDWSIQRASQEPDQEKKKLQVLQSCFWPMILTTLMQVVAQVCEFFNSIVAIYVSIVFVTLLRAFFIAIGTAYLRIRFPAAHFNKLLGIMSTASAVFTLFQFPLFIWESSSSEGAVQVHIFDSVCLLIAFIHPLLLLITPLQRYFFEKEKASNAET